MVELVDTPDLGSGAERCGGSSPPSRTMNQKRSVTLDSQFRLIRYQVYLCFFSLLLLAGCSSSGSSFNYNYPTGQQQRVLELCALVFTDPYYQYISPSRRVKLKRFRTTSWGFWATFADARTYRVPIVSGLAEGKDYYCNYRPAPTACASRNDWDERCEWDQTAHPNRFQ